MTQRPDETRAARAFLSATALDPATRARIRARGRTPRRRPLAWGLAAAGAGAVLSWWIASPAAGPPPALVEMPEHVQVRFDGEGTIGGTAEAPRLDWVSGVAHVQVEPDQGVTLTVSTEEATVRVIGTAFDVARAHFATEVRVDHGRVGVTCAGAPERILTDGEHARCLPADLPSLLKRVAALSVAGDDPALRLESLDRADPLATEGSARGELLAHRVQALQDAHRPEAALAAAATYLDEGHPARRADLLSYVAHQRFDAVRCEATEVLELAVSELPPGPEWLLLASCLQHTAPARARELVHDAAPRVDGAWATLAQQLREALPEVHSP